MVRPCLVNRPSSIATKKPAESMAGTTPTFSVVFSGGPKFVGRELAVGLPSPADAEESEQPAVSPATAVSATAPAAVRRSLPMPANGTPH